MWSQQISFPRALRDVQLVCPHGQSVVRCDLESTAGQAKNAAHAADRATQQQPLEDGPTRNESAKPVESDHSAVVIEQLCHRVLAELAAIDKRRAQSILDMKQVAIEVAVAIASRVLMVQIPAGDQNVVAMVNEAVTFFDKPSQLAVFLNPEDLAGLDQSDCATSFAAHESVSLQPDPAVPRGNCKVASDTYSALFDWEERLEHWRHELLQAVTESGDQ